jgi:hypothetical protein
MVTAGNEPWWLITSGASVFSKRATLDSGTCVLPSAAT